MPAAAACGVVAIACLCGAGADRKAARLGCQAGAHAARVLRRHLRAATTCAADAGDADFHLLVVCRVLGLLSDDSWLCRWRTSHPHAGHLYLCGHDRRGSARVCARRTRRHRRRHGAPTLRAGRHVQVQRRRRHLDHSRPDLVVCGAPGRLRPDRLFPPSARCLVAR